MHRSSTPGGSAKSPASIPRTVLFWVCLAIVCAALCGTDHLARKRESARVKAFRAEEYRRFDINADFQLAMYEAQSDRSPESFQKRFGAFGTVTSSRIANSNNGWEVHIKNAATGDSMNAVISNHGTGGNVEFSNVLFMHSGAWQFLSNCCRWIPILAPVLLLGGFLSFFVPRHLRKWIVGIALLVAITSTFGPDESKPPMLTAWSIAPLATLLIACLAAMLPKPKRRSKTICRHCGYNLTGNVSGVCPECGTPWRLVNLNEIAGNLEIIE